MASTGFTKQSWLTFFNGLEPNEKETLAKELGLQQIPIKKNKTKNPNKPFNPNLCHARMFCNDPDSDQKHPSKYVLSNQIAYQCCSPIVEDGLCKLCLNSKKRKCTDKGITPFGKFNDQQDPDFFTRNSIDSKKKYVYLIKGKPIPEEYKSENIPKKITKKNTNENTTKDDDVSIDDIDWKHKITNDGIRKLNVKTLKTFAQINSISFNTSKIKKSDYIREVEKFLRNKYDIPLLETPQDETPHVETPQDDESTQDINESSAIARDEELFREQESRLQNQVNLARTELEALQQDDDDLFAENEDDDEDDDTPTIEIQSVIYHISDGFAIDITTGDKLGPIDEDPDDWKSAARKIHAKNLEMQQKNM